MNSLQPPSGGCVLKRTNLAFIYPALSAAAFGRLCVETAFEILNWCRECAAAFGRLCVETFDEIWGNSLSRAAAFGRLCVETIEAF